jgi:hypothetical protein
MKQMISTDVMGAMLDQKELMCIASANDLYTGI